MLEKHHKDIDAIIVSSADHMHYSQCIAAMDLGKHMYTEKPLTHDIWEARKLTEMAANKKLVTQVGNQGASGDGTRRIDAVIKEDVIGDVKQVHVWINRLVWSQGIPVPKEIDWNLWLGTAPWREYHEAFVPNR